MLRFIDTAEFKDRENRPVKLPPLVTVGMTAINKDDTPFVLFGKRLAAETILPSVHGYALHVMGMTPDKAHDYFVWHEQEMEFRDRRIGTMIAPDTIFGHAKHRADKHVMLTELNKASLIPQCRTIIDNLPPEHLAALSHDGRYALGSVVEVYNDDKMAYGFVKAGEIGAQNGKAIVLIEIRPLEPKVHWFQNDRVFTLSDDMPVVPAQRTDYAESVVVQNRPTPVVKKQYRMPKNSPFAINQQAHC